jgi:hypothetical protein
MDRKIQNSKAMKCRVPGCETVWVSELSVVVGTFVDRVAQFHLVCIEYDFIPQQWSCKSCKGGNRRRRY